MSSEGCRELEHLVSELLNCSPESDTPEPHRAKDIVVDISEVLSSESSSLHHDLFNSIILGDKGLVWFTSQAAKHQSFSDAKRSALEIIKVLVDKYSHSLQKYASKILSMSLLVYTVDKAAKVRCAALDLFRTLIIKVPLEDEPQLNNMQGLVNKFCLGIKGSKVPSVVYHELYCLGALAYAVPEKARPQSEFILKVLKDQLMKHTGTRPELTILAGCLRGLALYLRHFPEGDLDCEDQYTQLYSHIHKIIDPTLNLPKRDSQRAALELISEHAAKFSHELVAKYNVLFPWLLQWCSSHNRDDSKAGRSAMDAFMVVVAGQMQLDDQPLTRKAFVYLMKQFNKLLEAGGSDSDAVPSIHSINIAVRGYGLLAGACKALLPPEQLHQLFSNILSASHHAVYRSSELLETKLTHLPTYLQAIAAIIDHMPQVEACNTQRILSLAIALVQHYPSLGSAKQYLAHTAIVALLAGQSATTLQLRYMFVYQALLQSCSHLSPLEVEQYSTGAQWRGVADQPLTYASFLPLWNTLLNAHKTSKLKITGVPVLRLTQISAELITEYFSCLSEIIEKLDLSTMKKEEKPIKGDEDVKETDAGNEATFSDPVAGLIAKTPKDFQVYHNLVQLTSELLSGLSEESSDGQEPWSVVLLVNTVVRRASLEPLVASHYSLLSALLKHLHHAAYFTRPTSASLGDLVCSFVKDVSERSKQFSDHLLASCLMLLLNLPPPIATRVSIALLHPLQVALVMGLSYPPVGEAAVACLQRWADQLSTTDDASHHAMLRQQLSQVLPKLLPYLTSRESESSELQSRVITVKLSLLNQHRRVDLRKLKEAETSSSSDSSALQTIQLSIIRLLGNLDTELCECVGKVPQDEIAEVALRWDKHNHVPFKVPYQTATLDLHLDELLPQMVHLALYSTDRQTKIAASELLHAVVIIMIGNGRTALHPPAPVYRRVFAACLKLACDPDHVSRQLFLTLIMQCIHYFTNNRGFEHPDTAALLQCIMEGLEHPSNPALRDLSARCLLEFLSWSRRQSMARSGSNSGVHPNVKSVVKRMIYLLCHPSAYKRIGGCLALNTVYTELREDSRVVDQWLVELLWAVVTCFTLADMDDPALPTASLSNTALNHIVKILTHYAELFNKPSSERRLPEPLIKTSGTLRDVLMWLLRHATHPATELRHALTALSFKIAPHIHGVGNLHDFMSKEIIKTGNLDTLYYRSDTKRSNADEIIPAMVDGSRGAVSAEHLQTYMKSVLALLDGFTFFIGQRLLEASQLLCGSSSQTLLPSIKYFLTSLSMVRDFSEHLRSISQQQQHAVYSVSKAAALLQLKCTLIIRTLDFIKVVMAESKEYALPLLKENYLLSADTFKLAIACVLEPATLGFSLRDTQVLDCLLPRMKEIISSLLKTLQCEDKQKLLEAIRDGLTNINILDETLSWTTSESSELTLSQHLRGVSLLLSYDEVQNMCGPLKDSLASGLMKWSCDTLFNSSNEGSTVTSSSALHAQRFIEVAVELKPSTIDTLLDVVCAPRNNEAVLTAAHHRCVLRVMLQELQRVMSYFTRLLEQPRHKPVVLQLLLAVVNHLLKDFAARKRYSRPVLESMLVIWPQLVCCDGSSQSTDSELVSLLTSMFLVDSEAVIITNINESKLSPDSHSILKYWLGIINSSKHSLQLKLPALKLLSFFMNMTATVRARVVDSLGVFKALHFPLKSHEFPVGSARDREYQEALTEILSSFELTAAPELLRFISILFCGESSHRYANHLQDSLSKQRVSSDKLQKLLECCHEMVLEQRCASLQDYNAVLIRDILLPLVRAADTVCLEQFFISVMPQLFQTLNAPLPSKSDEQLVLLTLKMEAFSILQLVYAKLSCRQVFSSTSAINAAFKPGDTTGKEFTKEVLRVSLKIAKGEYRHDKTHQELRRQIMCAAYNTLVAVVCSVQKELKFYTNFLFTENALKGEALWSAIIDVNKVFTFDTEVNFKPNSRGRFIAVRKSYKGEDEDGDGGNRNATVRMFATNYLSDSSLREDLSQYDFSSAVVLAVGEKKIQHKMEDAGGLVSLNLDSSDFNEHEVMGPLTAAVLHMQEQGITPAPPGDGQPTELPSWIEALNNKLIDVSTPHNVKLFILRLMMNASTVFAPYAALLVDAVLQCIAEGVTGMGITYYLADLVVMLVSWGSKGVPQSPVGRGLLRQVMSKLVTGVPHVRADIFKYNIELVRTLVSVWKSAVTLDGHQLATLIEMREGQQREVEAGLHIAACMFMNNLSPYDQNDQEQCVRVSKAIVMSMTNPHATVYGAAGEVTGMLLKTLHDKDHAIKESVTDSVVSRLTELLGRSQAQALSCLYYLHKHYQGIASKLASRLLVMLPKLYGVQKSRALECLVEHMASVEDSYRHLCHHSLNEILITKEPATQLVALKLFKSVLPNFTASQTNTFLPSVLSLVRHPSATCREVVLSILFSLYEKFREATDEDAKTVHSDAKDALLVAVNDQDTELRHAVLEFWTSPATGLTPSDLVLYILKELHSSSSEDSFLTTACHIILQVTRLSPSYTRPIYEQPLTQCKFWEMHVSPVWQARHASMVPLFSNTQGNAEEFSQGNLSDLVSLTQGGSAAEALGAIAATQDKKFTPTQTVPVAGHGSYDNTFVGVTLQEDEANLVEMQDKVNRAPSQSSTGLVFSTSSSSSYSSSYKHLYKKTGLGRSRMKPVTSSEDETDSSSTMTSILLKRRFVRQQDREKQSMHFARLEEKRRAAKQRLQLERKQRREAQVTMLREYRVGELPDIQILHRSVIEPLQALAQKDLSVARHVLVMVIEGLMDGGDSEWQSHLKEALCSLLENSSTYPPQLMKAIIRLLVSGNMKCSSDALTTACISSGQEPLGILLLEKYLLDGQKKLKSASQAPARKRQKTIQLSDSDSSITEQEINRMSVSLAELYGSVSMWDAVRGILHDGLSSSINKFTRDALHAEALNHHKKAYDLYLSALTDTTAGAVASADEQRLWEERLCSAASQLGQWGTLDTFVTQRFLTDASSGACDLNNVWNYPRPTAVLLPTLMHSKIMNLLGSTDADGSIVDFINSSLQDSTKRSLLEDNLAPQIALLSIYQEKPEVAQMFLDISRKSLLQTLSQHSILSPKPLTPILCSSQLLVEMDDFLFLEKKQKYGSKAHNLEKVCKRWLNKLPTTKDDKILVQCIAMYRDLYGLLLEKHLDDDTLKSELHKIRANSHIAVAHLALETENLNLAIQHIKKLDPVINGGLVEESFIFKKMFLLTHVAVKRSQQSEPSASIKFLIEAWCRHLGKVDAAPTKSLAIDLNYLNWEAILCRELCSSIKALGRSYDQNNQYLKTLASKFPDVNIERGSSAWYSSLLECSYNDLNEVINKCEAPNNSSDVSNSQRRDAYDAFAKFCDEACDMWKSHVDVEKYLESFISATLKGMACGSSYAHYRFPRLICILQEHPSLSKTFDESVKDVPPWMFLLWLPHLMIYIDKAPGMSLQPIIKQMAEIYPQAVFYPFNVSKTGYNFEGKVGRSALKMCKEVQSTLEQKCPILNHFLEAMLLVKEPFGGVKVELDKMLRFNIPDSVKVAKLQGVYNDLFKTGSSYSSISSSLSDPSVHGTGNEYGEQFRTIHAKIKTIFTRDLGEGCKKLKTLKGTKLNSIIAELLKCWSKTTNDLKSYSPWLANFQSSHIPEILEVPGQYTGLAKPVQEYHVRISNFDNNLKVMKSLRKPIVLTMHGTDERAYKFLVKTGEDLRTDQRIEMMFSLMNNIYGNSSVTQQLSNPPSLVTFTIVPLSTDLGLLQWVDSTIVLKEFLEDSLQEQERRAYDVALNKFATSEKTSHAFLSQKKEQIVRNYADCVNNVPWDLLRRALHDLSSNYESFFLFCKTFLSSHAVLSISQWILGIGDRHLSNFLVDYKSGKMVGIDFGHHFESAVQFLGHPELIPFRMTPQIVNVSKPHGTGGIIRESMISCLQALVESRGVITAAVEAFAKEPTQDWIQFVKRQEGTPTDRKIEDYSAGKMEMINRKLNGINPCVIFEEVVKKNKSLDGQILKSISQIIFGDDQKRSNFQRAGLSVPEQVDALLDLATDPNVLGRTYAGWNPWI